MKMFVLFPPEKKLQKQKKKEIIQSGAKNNFSHDRAVKSCNDESWTNAMFRKYDRNIDDPVMEASIGKSRYND